MKRITAYCRRTVLTAAREYARPAKRRTPESTKAAFRDAMNGTDTGWWCDLIYTAPMLDMASRYRGDIASAVRDYLSETGEALGNHCDRDKELTWADILASTRKRATWADYQGENGRDRETDAMALLFGLRFAVEYCTGNLAREYCPDL
jgi:hypothetical protein